MLRKIIRQFAALRQSAVDRKPNAAADDSWRDFTRSPTRTHGLLFLIERSWPPTCSLPHAKGGECHVAEPLTSPFVVLLAAHVRSTAFIRIFPAAADHSRGDLPLYGSKEFSAALAIQLSVRKRPQIRTNDAVTGLFRSHTRRLRIGTCGRAELWPLLADVDVLIEAIRIITMQVLSVWGYVLYL